MDSVLITLGAPYYRWEGRLFVEDQTISGLKAWRENFGKVLALSVCKDGPPPEGWSDAAGEGVAGPDFELIELPDGYHLPTYLRERRGVEARLLDAMRRADYRLFAIGGWIGDWGVTGARVARRNRIPHGIWFDRVESQVIGSTGNTALGGRLKAWAKSRIVARTEREVLRGADLALLHGRTVFDRLGPLSRNPQIVEDIHLEAADRIPADRLDRKLEAAAQGPLRICYVGRAAAMKGARHWIDTLEKLAAHGAEFTADWAGEGELLDEMKRRAAAPGLSGRVTFHGFVAERERVLELLREAHLLLFCHMTDESPRNLIEALHAATPLVGFRDPFAAALVDEQGAGLLVDRGDTGGLAEALAALAADRTRLRDLISRAARSARHLTRAEVFAHRSHIVKSNLNTG